METLNEAEVYQVSGSEQASQVEEEGGKPSNQEPENKRLRSFGKTYVYMMGNRYG